jgi:hypothetical protein
MTMGMRIAILVIAGVVLGGACSSSSPEAAPPKPGNSCPVFSGIVAEAVTHRGLLDSGTSFSEETRRELRFWWDAYGTRLNQVRAQQGRFATLDVGTLRLQYANEIVTRARSRGECY